MSVLTEVDRDHRALAAACEPGVALCTVVGIEGSFSRPLGAQLAVHPDGSVIGDLADGCLESQLASDVRKAGGARVVRYGRGSDNIDFRLPCGGGLDILLDPAPDRAACRAALESLGERRPAGLTLPGKSPLRQRRYLPALRLRLFGQGPEFDACVQLAAAAHVAVEAVDKDSLRMGSQSGLPAADKWTAILLLFHDHEWEAALLEEALASDAFYIGAQGGERARRARLTELLSRGVTEEALARLTSPVGVVPICKTPETLALSALAQVTALYEGLRDHG